MRRQHMQVYLSEQLIPSNPLDYVFFTQNASEGENFGLESEARYRPRRIGSSRAARRCCAHAISA